MRFLIIILFSLFIYLDLYSQHTDYKFEHLSIANGLSHNTVTGIIQDHKGFIWIGTNDGLNLYDGYSFRVFKADAFDSTSISSNKITKLLEDSKERIWIGTRNGLSYFDWKTFNFKQVSFSKFKHAGSQVFIKALFEDKFSNLWIGTYGLGLFRYDYNSESLVKVPLEYDNHKKYQELDRLVSNVYEDSRGNLWIGTNRNGLILLDRTDMSCSYRSLDPEGVLPENTFVKTIFEDREGYLWVCSEYSGVFQVRLPIWDIKHYINKTSENSLSNNIAKDIFQDKNGLIWIATDGGGINILDKNTGKFQHLKYDIREPSSISGNAIYTFFKDNRDIVWIGTFGAGINILDPNKKPFFHYTQKETEENSLSHPSVLSFTEDSKGFIWIGTDGGGLNRFNPINASFQSYQHDPEDAGSLSSNAVTSVLEDSWGNLWVGTYAGGLNLFDRSRGRFYAYTNDENDPGSITNNNVWVLYETNTRQLLVGTLNGLDLLDREKMEFIHLRMYQEPVRSFFDRILSITEDHDGNIWIGSGSLWKLSLRDTSIVEIPLIIDTDTLDWEYDVREVFEDSREILWVGTEGGGLLKYDRATGSFIPYTENSGLPNNAVNEILEDAYGNLWISTNKGLSRFNPLEEEFRNYDNTDGLQSNQFSYSGSLLSQNGSMYFGGVNGFNIFDPAEIKDNRFIPPVVFTDFRLFNRPVSIRDEDSPLKFHISETDHLTLKHNQSVLTFEFASLNYTSTSKNQYEFIMEGFEESWNTVGSQRTATYTNLDPGDYTLRIRGSNNDGIWNENGASMKITVLPPFWETSLAFVIYGLLILLLLLSFRRYAISRAQMKNELKLKDLEKQKIEEVNQMKMQFFTNVSHEFRTPLTLIMSPLEKLMDSSRDKTTASLYKLMYRNANRLLSLINQLMDLRKIEKGSMDLKLTHQDIIAFVKDIKNAFDELAEEKKIEFLFSSNIPNMMIYFDTDKIDKIVYNLLSNAFKFTPVGGKVSVKVKLITREEIRGKQSRKLLKKDQPIQQSLAGGYVEISVKDNGIGIPKENQDKVFNRFYQAPTGMNLKNPGTGIGLSLSRDLSELHKGQLNLISSDGKGSKFSLLLPIDKSCYSTNDFLLDKQKDTQILHQEVSVILNEEYDVLGEEDSSLDTREKGNVNPTVLIVEDNPDVRKFIRISLEPVYKIIEAKDGVTGLEISRKEVPDIIVSDIMMPEMDGIEMAKKLYDDQACSHIPVIFLTAKTEEQSKLIGLETGVIDYINKPFNPRILELKIRNIIRKQRKHAEQIRKSLLLEPSEVEIESMDEKFLKRAVQVVEDHMSDSDFDVQQFVEEMGMSRSVLYRKLRAVTNQSANEFINVIRLKRAAQLLIRKNMNVSEISYLVGFNDPQYFSKCFRKYYGKTPSQYSATVGESTSVERDNKT
jgi:signal transduction histidine kinase/ligand-binding sensor domain-containing protein/DNA-binding response OmpR family regulator